MNADSQCLKNSQTAINYAEEVPGRNCLEHFNGRRDVLPKCHSSTHIFATTRKRGAAHSRMAKKLSQEAICAIDLLRAGIRLAHFPETMSRVRHFETVKVAAITDKLNEPVHHELSLRLRAARSIRVGLWCQPKKEPIASD